MGVGVRSAAAAPFCLLQVLEVNQGEGRKLARCEVDPYLTRQGSCVLVNRQDHLLSKQDESWLWHRRIAHIHMNHLNKLISRDLVIGLPKLKFERDHICEACQKGKQVKSSFKICTDQVIGCDDMSCACPGWACSVEHVA